MFMRDLLLLTPLRALRKLWFKDVSDSIPWRGLFLNILTISCPEQLLPAPGRRKGLRRKFAEMIGVSQSNISEMESGKRPIGKNMARRFAKVLKVGYKIFL